MNLLNIENEIKKIKDSGKDTGTYPIFYKGKTRQEKVYEIPPNLLRFNYLNGRIGTEAIEFKAIHATDLGELSIDEANDIIHDWIWNKTAKDNKKTLEDIRDKSQIIPGVITRDGIVVDGNRRFMISRILNKDGLNRQFKAIILDDTYSDGGESEFQIKRLEAEIQMGQDEKVKYGAIEPYLRIMDFVDNYIESTSSQMTYDELCKIMSIKSIQEAKKKYRVGKLMVEYLKYIGFDKMWSRLENTEDLFIKLEFMYKIYTTGSGGKAGWERDDDDIEKYKFLGFDLIRWNYNADTKLKDGWDSKKIREKYFKNSQEKAIFSKKGIWNEFEENLESIEEIKVPEIKDIVKEEGLSHSDAAKKIDNIWVQKASPLFKEALGKAESKLIDNENTNRPEQFLRDALDKLTNLIDENLFESADEIEFKESLLNLLQNKDKIKRNYNYVNRIRKISESLKRLLK